MNASRLREVVDLLLKIEEDSQLQSKLSQSINLLNNIIQQPQSENFQTQFASLLDNLHTTSQKILGSLQPVQLSLIDELGGSKFFTTDIADFIDGNVKANVMTPAVARDKIQSFLTDRQKYLQQITQLKDALFTLGIEANNVQPGDAELGILIPRSLFDNDLELLIKELSEIRFVVRAFSEVALGSAEKIEVRQISTTDPNFFSMSILQQLL
jgi:hypothetical protein